MEKRGLYFIDSKFVHETGVDTVNISCVINNIGLSKSEKEFCEFLITEAGHDIKENWVTKKLKTWNVRKCKENENLKTIEDDINKTLNDILENDIRSFEKEFFKPILEKMNVEFDLNKEDNDLQSVVIENGDFEGKTIKYYTTKYERSMKNRRDAISAHGTKCMVCGFDFKSCYGELGEGFIEVHHIKPLFDLQEEIRVNPSTDLVCLCSNCHSMIHRKKGYMFSVKELKELLQDNKKGR